MKLADFDYQLPKSLIAQHPVKPRDSSRLLVINRHDKNIRHLRFSDLVDFLNAGDCLVLNNTKVLAHRLIGQRKPDNLKADLLLLNQIDKFTPLETKGRQEKNKMSLTGLTFRALMRPYKKLHQDDTFIFNGGKTKCEIVDIKNKIVRFDSSGSDILTRLERIGLMPLPPYIKRLPSDEDRDDYQTVYAKAPGAIASPTAGLHFTKELLERIKAKGVNIAYITLHVGYGTFRPIRCDNVIEHKMEREHFLMPRETFKILKESKKNNKRIFCVGTTVCRTLETVADKIYGDSDTAVNYEDWTDLFIYPGYKFRITDCLITNFHLPRTTLLMLVCAFAGRNLIMSAYAEAIEVNYRFYSFGDAMLLL